MYAGQGSIRLKLILGAQPLYYLLFCLHDPGVIA